MSFAETANLNFPHPLSNQRIQELAIDSLPLVSKSIVTYGTSRYFSGPDILSGLIQSNGGAVNLTMATGLAAALSNQIGNYNLKNASFECLLRNNQATGIVLSVTDTNLTYYSTGAISGYGSIGLNFVLTNSTGNTWSII